MLIVSKSYFSEEVFGTLLGGKSPIDVSGLMLADLGEVSSFVKAYGFDLENPKDQAKAWETHANAVKLIQEKILKKDESLPAEISDPLKLLDVRNLFLMAHKKSENRELQKWACAMLRVMHVFTHTEKDVFYQFSGLIQEQVLSLIHI